MLSNYWNPPFSYLIIIKKDVCRNLSKLISFLFSNHPGTYTDRGEKLRWQKHNLNLINYNFSNYISASILTQNSFYVWKENLWCIFENHSASPNFSSPRTYWRKNWRSACAGQDFSFKNGTPPDSRHILSLGCNGAKHQNWNVDFHKNQGNSVITFCQENSCFFKSDLFRNLWKSFRYDVLHGDKDFLQLKRHMILKSAKFSHNSAALRWICFPTNLPRFLSSLVFSRSQKPYFDISMKSEQTTILIVLIEGKFMVWVINSETANITTCSQA